MFIFISHQKHFYGQKLLNCQPDLFGTSFTNAFEFESNDDNSYMARPIHDGEGNIVGSEGWLQEILFYITDSLNLTMTTISSEYSCWYFLDRKMADVCTNDMPHHLLAFGFIPLQTRRTAVTLLAGVRTETAPDSWVYIEVFGFWQWFTLVTALFSIAILWEFTQFLLEETSQGGNSIALKILRPILVN